MPAWATRPTHDRSSAESARYHSWLASIRRIAALARSPLLRSTRRRVASEAGARADGIRPLYLYAAHNEPVFLTCGGSRCRVGRVVVRSHGRRPRPPRCRRGGNPAAGHHRRASEASGAAPRDPVLGGETRKSPIPSPGMKPTLPALVLSGLVATELPPCPPGPPRRQRPCPALGRPAHRRRAGRLRLPPRTHAGLLRARCAHGGRLVEPDLVSTKDHVLVARHENEIWARPTSRAGRSSPPAGRPRRSTAGPSRGGSPRTSPWWS